MWRGEPRSPDTGQQHYRAGAWGLGPGAWGPVLRYGFKGPRAAAGMCFSWPPEPRRAAPRLISLGGGTVKSALLLSS